MRMRRIVHLSDLHFGRVDDRLPRALLDAVGAASPDLVVISGDMTQRARVEEFEAARAFLAELPQPQLVVPGNHDIPLYDVFRRTLRPLNRFRRYISSDIEPGYFDGEIAVAGISTAR